MNPAVWLSFVGASFVFGLIPGPSVCFTIAHALKHGARRTLATITGQLAANCCQVVIVLFGLAGIIERSAVFFQGLKIAGAAYLICLGLRQWAADKPRVDIQKGKHSWSTRRAFIDGFVVCGTNPKAVIYYAALLPQFVLPQYDEDAQLIALAATSVAVAALVLVFYTVLAHKVRSWLNREAYWRTQNRLTGTLMIGAGLALLMVTK